MKTNDFLNSLCNNLMQAPLAGYTDVGFRYLCAKYNCGLIVSEMVSAMSLKQKNKVAFDMLGMDLPQDTKSKVAVQLFGHDPNVFAEVVKYDEIQKFDAIDINMGCPVPKVTRNGEGSALMLDLKKASAIIESCVKHSGKPVSVKFRKGYTDNNVNAVEFAKMCEDSGACMITVHGRTKEQMYSGIADWDIIGQVVKAVDIPVYANGDIKTQQDVDKVLEQTGAFGVAIGRGSGGKPWIFAQLAGCDVDVDVFGDIKTHYDLMLKHLPTHVVAGEMKKHVAAYFKGKRGVKQLLNEIFKTKTVDEQLDLLKDYFVNNQILQ